MSTKITMPQLGESIHEGTIGQWLKKPGEQIEKYEAICEIITDKVNAEIPSPVDGVLTLILAQEGQTVEIGAVIAEMQEVNSELVGEGSALRLSGNQSTDGAASHNPQPTFNDEPTGSFPAGRAVEGWYKEESILGDLDEEESLVGAGASENGSSSQLKENGKHRYSPAVRRLAEEHNLNLASLNIRGNGLGGRITRDDIMNYLAQNREVQPSPTVAPKPQPEPTIAVIGRNQPIMTAAMQVPGEVASSELRVPSSNIKPQNFATQANEAAFAEISPISNSQVTATETSNSPVPSNNQQPTTNNSLITDNPQPTTLKNSGPAFTAEMFAGSEDEIVGLTPMRKAIAEHMMRSKQTTPHAWTIVEVDMTRLVQHRARIKEEFKRREGVDLSFMPFMLKAVSEGLRQFPQLNAQWSPEKGGIAVKRELNLGIAVDVPDGLIVPVIHQAEEKSLVGLARSLNDLVTRARNKKLRLNDVQGGTFTVNNPGAFGSIVSYPIINQPQAGIITMEAIVKRPVVVTDAEGNDTIAIRSIMNMCLSFDHRVVDGAYAGRFLQFVKKWLETEAPKREF